MKALVLVLLLALGGCVRIVDLRPPPDAANSDGAPLDPDAHPVPDGG